MLGRADTREDEEKVLKEAFGLSETEFTRDRRGRLALTPEGAQKFGIETDIPILIDEKGFTRQDLWFDASRTRVLPSVHQEAVDAELAKRANKERDKRARKAAKAKAAAEDGA